MAPAFVPATRAGCVIKQKAMESVVAVFNEPRQAQHVLESLKAQGFGTDHLAFSMVDAVAKNELAQATGISPEEGMPGGTNNIVDGMFKGGLAGLAMTVPVWALLNLITETRIYAHGGLLAMLYALIGGVGLGGLFGALTGSDSGNYVKLLRNMGVPNPQAERLSQSVQDGHILVFARSESPAQAEAALNLMHRSGALKLEDAVGGGRLQSERIGHAGH